MTTTRKPQKHPINWQVMVLLMLPAVLPLLYSTSGVDPALIPRQLFATLITGGLACVLFMQKQQLSFTQIPVATGILVLLYAVSCFQAINTIESVYITLKIGLFTSLVWIIYTLVKRKVLSIRQISLAISIAGIITILMTIANMLLLERKGIHIFDSDNMYKVSATFGHKNLLSSFLFLCMPLMLVQLVLSDRRLWKIALSLSVTSALGLLLILQTRAVLLALIICTLVTLLLIVSGFSASITRVQKRIIFLTALLILAGSVTIFYVYKEKLSLITRTESFTERKNLWDNTWQMIREHPLTGVGAANWQIQMPKYGMQKFYEVNYAISEGLTNFQRPHNDFLWVWAETGVAGFICYGFIFFSTLVFAFRLLKRDDLLRQKIIYALIILQVTGFIVISMVDFPLERMEHPIIMIFMVSFVAAKYDEVQRWKGVDVSRMVWLLVMGLTILSLYVCVQRWKSELQLRKMYNAHKSGHWSKLVIEGNKAQQFWFNMDYYSIPVKWYVGVGYFMQNNLPAAKQSFEEAYQLHPYQVHVLNNYGTCFEKEGDHEKAIELLRKSHELSPTFSDGIINLSGACFNAGNYDEAFKTICKFRYDEQNDRFKTFAVAIIRVKLEDYIVKENTTPFATYLKGMVSDDRKILEAFRMAQNEKAELVEWLRRQSEQ